MNLFLNPEEILNNLELKKQMIAADFGCGAGNWTIPLAQKLNEGEIYAFDIQEEMLSALKGQLSLKKISNVHAIACDLERQNGSGLPNSFSDLVLIINFLFQIENKEKIIEEAQRILKNNGLILIIDWEKEAVFGPKQNRVSRQEIKDLAKKFDLKIKKEFSAGKYHYALLLIK